MRSSWLSRAASPDGGGAADGTRGTMTVSGSPNEGGKGASAAAAATGGATGGADPIIQL